MSYLRMIRDSVLGLVKELLREASWVPVARADTTIISHVLQTTWNLWKVVIVAFLVSRRAIGMPGVLEYN